MAIGENSYFNSGSDNNATRKTTPEYSYYSRFNFTNEDQTVSLRFEFRSGLLQFKLYTKDGNGYWGQEPKEIIYLSSAKAAMLDKQIEKFKEYVETAKKIDENVAFGVNGGMNEKVSFIAFHAKADKSTCITIGKFDGNGTITESLTYQLKKDYNYGLDWKNLQKMDIDKAFFNSLELEMIHNMVKDFARSMSGAMGYGIHDLGRYDLGRVLTKLDPIYDKLGIERMSSGYNKPRGTNNFLNGVGSSSGDTRSEHTSIDDLMGL